MQAFLNTRCSNPTQEHLDARKPRTELTAPPLSSPCSACLYGDWVLWLITLHKYCGWEKKWICYENVIIRFV